MMVTKWVSKQESKDQMKNTREVTSNTEIKKMSISHQEK